MQYCHLWKIHIPTVHNLLNLIWWFFRLKLFRIDISIRDFCWWCSKYLARQKIPPLYLPLPGWHYLPPKTGITIWFRLQPHLPISHSTRCLIRDHHHCWLLRCSPHCLWDIHNIWWSTHRSSYHLISHNNNIFPELGWFSDAVESVTTVGAVMSSTL